MKKIISLLSIVFFLNANGQTITTVAGDGTAAYTGDGGQATLSQLNNPNGITTDASGNVYFVDQKNNAIRKIDNGGVITTIAGTGYGKDSSYCTTCYSGDGGPATNADLNHPTGIVIDASGNIYFTDSYNQRIRKISAAGIITTIAGNGSSGNSGNGGLAANASLSVPEGIAIDASSNIYFVDYNNHQVRKINSGGIISLFAGTGSVGFSGDGGLAVNAQLFVPVDVAVDNAGNVYISDNQCHRIRKVNTSGIISTFAGTSMPGSSGGYSGDGGPATSAVLQYPTGICTDALGNVYIADTYNYRVRKVDQSGVITTVAGTGTPGWSGDGGFAYKAKLNAAMYLTIDASNNCYITQLDNRIRKVTCAPFRIFFNGSPSNSPRCIMQGGPSTTTITATGGTTYTWSPNAGSANTSSVVVSPSNSQVYTVSSDHGTCISSNSFYINIVATVPPISILGPDTVCTAAQVITYTAVGAQTYTWTSNNAFYGYSLHDSLFRIGDWYNQFLPGTATLTAVGMDTLGCKDSVQRTIVYYGPTITVTSPHMISIGSNNYLACGVTSDTLTAHGGLSYNWCCSGITTPSVSVTYPNPSNYFNVVAYDNRGCTDTLWFFVRASQPSVTYTLVADATPHTWDCYPTYSTNNPPYTYSWDWGDATTPSTTAYTSHVYATAGSYSICATITDGFGCSSTYCQNDAVSRLGNNSPGSSMVYVNVLAPTSGIDQNLGNVFQIAVYPNPATDQLFFDANTTEKINVDLFDVKGRHVFSKSLSDRSTIDVSDLSEGVYTLTIKTVDGVVNKKLVILR